MPARASAAGPVAERRVLAQIKPKSTVSFQGMAAGVAMSGIVKGFGRLRTKASSAGTRGPHALVYG